MSVTACVDYDPAEGAAAICGLDAPDAQALVTYTNELGTESTLTLTVGLPDGSGGRYVTVNDDPTIYRMEETSLVKVADAGGDRPELKNPGIPPHASAWGILSAAFQPNRRRQDRVPSHAEPALQNAPFCGINQGEKRRAACAYSDRGG